MKKCLLIKLFMILLMLTNLSYARGDYELVINQSENKLFIKKHGVTMRIFHVALGSGGPHGKQHEGDRKTPLGQYKIVKVRASDRFHLFMQLDYPSVRDAARALKHKVINRDQYRAILDAHIYGGIPPQNTRLGGAIGIHGIGQETRDKLEIHQIADWTQGCIALKNAEIDQLRHYIEVGTPVKIIE